MKKALLVGINDYGVAPLRGCVNDIIEMKAVLTELFGFDSSNVRILSNEKATFTGIVDGLAWLSEGREESAVRVFYYAGHGHGVPDQSGDEPDGTDEALVPYDYTLKGFLIDDQLATIYSRFSTHVNLSLILDSCHNGTNQRDPNEDIMYRYLPMTYEERKAVAAARRKFMQEQREFVMQEIEGLKSSKRDLDVDWEARILESMKKFEKQRFGDITVRENNILMAACQSDQKAADAKFGATYHGAFTYALVKTLRESQGQISYCDLVERVGNQLHDHSFQQTPQLECATEKENLNVFSPF